MKKILLLVLMAVMTVGMQAQQIMTLSAKNVAPHSSASATLRTPGSLFSKSAPFKKKTLEVKPAEGSENQKYIGSYNTDEYLKSYGYGLYDMVSTPANVSMATLVPASGYKKMNGGKIKSIRLAMAQPCDIARVFIYNVTDEFDISLAYEQEVNKKAKSGWNSYELTKEFELPTDGYGILLGYEFVQTADGEAISVVDKYAGECSWLIYGNFGSGEGWYDFSAYGALSVQALVECESLPEIDVVIDGLELSEYMISSNSSFYYGFNYYNYGTAKVKSFEIDVKLDDEVIETLTQSSMEITETPDFYVGMCALPEDFARGTHSFSVSLKSVNGAPASVNTDDDSDEVSFSSYKEGDAVERQKYLIEEMTSHSCTYCPYGAAVLEAMMDMLDNIALVCIHGNQSSKDPFNTEECEELLSYLGCQAYPSATFNRIYLNPEEGIAPSIGYSDANGAASELIDMMESYSIPAFASVNISTNLKDNDLKINVCGKGGDYAKELLKDYSLTVYVVEDGLKYRQLNNGSWVTNYTHNHVLRKLVTAVNGDDINWTSVSEYSNDFEVALDEKWVKENMSVVAMISRRQPTDRIDWTDMNVTNANSVKLIEGGSEPGTGDDPVEDPKVDANLRLSPINKNNLQILGESVSPNLKYVVGTNFATYAPVIWNTETDEITNFAQYEEGAFHGANNSGMAVGDDGEFALVVKADGTILDLYKEEGETLHNDEYDFDYTTGDAGSAAWAVSEDGKTIAGYYFNPSYDTYPCIWNENGERFDLPIPTYEELGWNVNGAGVRWMTPDAKVILGYLIDDLGTWPACLWRLQDDGTYKYDIINADYFETGYQQGKPYMIFVPTGLSENGQWVSLNVQEEYDDWDFSVPAPAIKAARLNLTTNTLEVLTMPSPFEKQPMAATGIANDGTMLMYADTDGLFGRIGYLWPAGKESAPVNLDETMSNIKDVPEIGGNTPCLLSSDGNSVMGFGISSDADFFSYIFDFKKYVSLDRVEAEAAIKQNNGKIYNIYGQPVSNVSVPGLYIIGDKKVIVRK